MKTLAREFSKPLATPLLAVCALLLRQGDATAATAQLVKDIDATAIPRDGLTAQSLIVGQNGVGLFMACPPTTGCELWRSNGTAAGTVLVKDIYPGPNGSSPLSESNSALLNGVRYFIATDPVHGRELWKSDGTAAGTVMVKDIVPGARGSIAPFLDGPVVSNGTLYFPTIDPTTGGFQLWKSN